MDGFSRGALRSAVSFRGRIECAINYSCRAVVLLILLNDQVRMMAEVSVHALFMILCLLLLHIARNLERFAITTNG